LKPSPTYNLNTWRELLLEARLRKSIAIRLRVFADVFISLVFIVKAISGKFFHQKILKKLV
jgi:hypothetical protein